MAEGDYLPTVSVPLPKNNVTIGENEVHDPWPPVTPSAPREMVERKFNQAMEMAEDMMIRLVGPDGTSGYLGALNDIITTYRNPELDAIAVNLITTRTSVPPRPVSDILESLDTNFGTFDEQAPVMAPLPVVDPSMAFPGQAPAAPVGAAVTWSEIALPQAVYDALMDRILSDMSAGGTGISPQVWQEIYDQAVSRQLTANDMMYREIEDYFGARGWSMPTGPMAGRLQEAAAEILRANRDINSKLTTDQAELAQKNSHFVIQQAIELEKLVRASRDTESDRKLDHAKAVADLVLKLYAEAVRAYLADAEAKKIYVEAQVAVLRGVIEGNRGKTEMYRAKAEVFKVSVEAKTGANQGIVEAFKAENIGYEAETRAISANQAAGAEDNKVEISRADLELRKQIAIIQAAIQGYVSESSLKEKVSNDMAQIAAQSVSAALNSFNASASLGYSGSESRSESFGHSESLSESHSFSAGLSESHNFEHDPTT